MRVVLTVGLLVVTIPSLPSPAHPREQFGAVPVSPRNMYRLLKRGDNVLLFPGGVSEALHKK